MKVVDREQTRDRVALERVASFARRQLIQAIDEMLASFVDVQALTGASDRSGKITGKRLESEHKRFCNIADALMQWHTNEKYLAMDGSPRALPVAGRSSLTTLTRYVVGSPRKAKRLVSDLMRFGLLEKVGNSYRPAGRSAVLGRANALNLAYSTLTTKRLLRTISHNVSAGRPPLFERQVSEVSIRNEDLPLYLRFIEQQAQSLIDSADDWLSRRQVHGASPKSSTKVGIGAFAWADLPLKIATPRHRRARRTVVVTKK